MLSEALLKPYGGMACFRPLGNLQRRVLRLPRPRKRSAACFDAFRGVGNLQRRVLTLSEASETFSGAFWYFPRPRGVRDACQVCRVRFFLRYPASFPAPAGAARDACPVCRVRFFLRYPASFPALAGAVRDACPVCRIRVFEEPSQLGRRP